MRGGLGGVAKNIANFLPGSGRAVLSRPRWGSLKRRVSILGTAPAARPKEHQSTNAGKQQGQSGGQWNNRGPISNRKYVALASREDCSSNKSSSQEFCPTGHRQTVCLVSKYWPTGFTDGFVRIAKRVIYSVSEKTS